jgi:hypothetical protein
MSAGLIPLLWQTSQNTTPVSITRTLLWTDRVLAGAGRTILWKDLTGLALSRQIRWRDLVPASVTRQFLWHDNATPPPPPPPPPDSTPIVTVGQAFNRVYVDYLSLGGGRISWDLSIHFLGKLPFTFQLQAGETGLNQASDWSDVGPPLLNSFTTIDPTQRTYGKTWITHYRVKLTTGDGQVFYSDPVDVLGRLNFKDWNIAREILRKERLRHTLVSPNGYLLKIKRSGEQCDCIDVASGDVIDSACPECFGTRWTGGYYPPYPVFMDLGNLSAREMQDLTRGTIKDVKIPGRFLGAPQLYAYDVWVNKESDERYTIHDITVAAHLRGVPIIVSAGLRLLPSDDIVYTVPVPTS